MSVRSKVNVVNSVQYHPSLRRFITDGKDETSAGIFTSGNHAWVTNGDKLSIVDTAKGCPRPVYSFGEDSKDPVGITCIEELVLDCTTPTPLLLVGTCSLYNSQLCVFNPAHSRVVRAIQLDNLQVTCMAVVEDGRSSLNSLTDVLSAMEGVVALGCADGSVVLVDLNRQTIIKAYQGNLLYRSSESTPQPLTFVSTVDEEATKIEICEAQQRGASSAITLIEGDGKDTEFGVKALTFSRETASLYIGYSSGLWQIWNLSLPTFSMMYECAECTSPVSSFCQIEPCEDPRPTVYLWVNHEGTDSSMPLLNMYSLSYANKHHVHDYGVYYQDFICCSRSFSMYPGEEFPNVISGRLVSAKAYSKTIKRHLIQNMGLPEMEGIQMKLLAATFSLTYTRGSTHTYLTVFDLEQWYKEQMPYEPNPDAPYIETTELSSEPLLASIVLIDSISLYHTEEPLEIHLVPQALSFKVIGLSESGLLTIEKIGLQKLWLANTEAIGAKSLIHPTKLFHACVSAGLDPMFPAHQNPETSVPTNEEMRSYIMSVCLDNGLINVILEVGEQWESGVHATSNCTLNFLFEWVWSSVSTAYKSVNGICNTLFSASGQELDVSVKRRLQLSRLILDRLNYIHTAFCSKYNHTLYADTLEPRLKAIDIITLFVHQLSWFVNVGLLPEANSKDLPKSAIRYDYLKLDRFAVDRRQRVNSLFAKFKRAGKAQEMPGAGLYLVDHFVHDYNELGQQWEDEGGSTAYPPPSVQSLLRSLRIPTVPTATKLALVQYTLLDIMSVIDKSKHEDLVSKVSTFHLLPKINATQTKVINGLWHLDHSLFEEGLQYLLDRTVTVSDLSEGLHRAILRMLLFEGKEKLAIQYLRLKNPPLSLPDDLKLEMSLLLANKLTSEAYHFQRGHTYLRATLLRQLFTECLVNGEIGKLVSFPLDEDEINFFHNHLAKNRCQRNDDLRVLLLITRSKFNEAKVLHEKLLATSTDRDQLKASTRDMIVNGLASTLCPMSREIYLQRIDPNLKNLPEFNSSKPRPLSVYVKTIDDGGFPNFGVSSQKLCASTIACSANLWRFVANKNGKSQFNDILREEPMICSEENTSLWSKQDSETPAPGKRAGTWVSGANKRQRMDEDATVQDEDIAAFVETPLVKRKSRELADPTTPRSTIKTPAVHSILKSGKTPGTPGRSVLADHDDFETPKKTLRWDIPTSEPQGGKEAVRKSLLSTSLLTPSEGPAPPPITSLDLDQESIHTPQDTDSIKSRLRSHTPSSANKKDVAIWNQIAEEAKAKVLFSLNLPTKKEKKLLPAKPVGPSFVVQINQLIEEEKLRKESDREKAVELPPGEFPTVGSLDDAKANEEIADKKDIADPKNEGVKMQDATPSLSRTKRLRFLDITIGSDERNLLEVSGSPFTTTAIPKEFRQHLRAKLRSPHDQAEGRKTAVEQEQESREVQGVAEAEPIGNASESQSTPKKMTSVKRHSKVLFVDSSFTKPNEDDDEFIIDELSSEESHQKKKNSTKLPMITVDAPDSPEKLNEDVHSSISAQTVETAELGALSVSQVDTSKSSSVEDVAKVDDELPKTVESGSSEETKNSTCKDKSLNAFTAQITPQIGSVVSLSRSHYAEDEDEVGSEDPEEAEIPPIMEFSQPEEGLVVNASYALKDNAERSDELEENEEKDNELEGIARVVENKSDNDSGSSVICLDSDSDDDPKNRTQLDYEGYEEDSYSLDSEEANQSSRGRRSFFHDKYNTHQEESEESPSPEYSSGDDEKRDSDVDLYNMDDIEDNDGMPKDDELDDEIFAMGRGIQERKDLEVSSEEDDEEEEYLDEEEDMDEEDDTVEEEDDDVSEITPVRPVSSQSSSLVTRLPNVDDDIQEVLSSEEEDAAVAKMDSKPQSSQDSESGGSSSDAPNPITTKIDSPKEENRGSTVSSVNMREMHDEDRSAVDALLELAEPPNDESDSINESNKDVEIPNEPLVEECPKKSEQNLGVSTPSKTTDVIDFLNLSQGQMFFGSPEVQIRDKPPDRALFQLGTSTFTVKCSESNDNKDRIVEKMEETKPRNEAFDSSTSEETLVLRLEEGDIDRAETPEVLSRVPELTLLPIYVGSSFVPPDSNVTLRESATTEERDIVIDDPHQKIVAESPSKGVVALSEGTASCELAFKGAEVAETLLETMPDTSDNVVQSKEPMVEQLNPTDEPVQSIEPAAVQHILEPVELSRAEGTNVPIEEVQEPGIRSGCDASLNTHQTSTTESTEMDNVVESIVTVDCVSKSVVSKLSSQSHHQDSSSPVKNQVQHASFSCQTDPLRDVEEPNPHPLKESVVCQTTFVESSPLRVNSKSFSCQAAMDTTRYGATTLSGPNVMTPAKPSQDSVTATCREKVEPQQKEASAHQEPPSAESPSVENTGAITESVPMTHISSSTKEAADLLISDKVADSSVVQIVLEPPTPFKTLKYTDTKTEEQDSKGADKSEDSDLGAAKLDDTIAEEQTADSLSPNPCDLAFVVESSFASMMATPKTSEAMTPLRKSLRLSRMSTPGRALAPDDEVNVSDSMLDIAVLDPEVSDEKPVLVDRSMITDKRGLDMTIVAHQSKGSLEKEVKSRKESHKSSEEKHHKERKKSSKGSDEAGPDKKEVVSKELKRNKFGSVDLEDVGNMSEKLQKDAKKRRSAAQKEDVELKRHRKPKSSRASSSEPEDGGRHRKPKSSRASSSEPEDGGRHRKPKSSRASSSEPEDGGRQRKPKSSRASSEPEDGERHRKSRHCRASSVGSDNKSSRPKEDTRPRRCSSVQPETRDYAVETVKRKGRRSQSVEQEIPSKEPKKESASQMSTGSESSYASRYHDQAKRHSSVEPETKPRRRDSRRASSEGSSSDVGHGSSRKRQSSLNVDTKDSSPSPLKLRRLEETFAVSDDGEYRKMRIRHSITEPLEKKKHQLEEQTSGEPNSKKPRRSELPEEDVSMTSTSSGRKRRSKSLSEYPYGRSMRPSVLTSIQELPEDSPRPAQSKTTSMRASTDNISALDSLMSTNKRIDISKWMALSYSQVSRARRLSGKTSAPVTPAKKTDSEHLDLGAFVDTLVTPAKEDATSPTGSITSITSTASSKVLRSGRVIDENTPTRRPREWSAKQRAARTLKLSANSPAKVLRSGRAVGDDDRMSVTTDGEEDEEMDVRSGTTYATSAHSASEFPELRHHEMSMDEVMSSRRLTRHQRSVLEASMAAPSRGRLSPVEASPSPVPKMESKKN